MAQAVECLLCKCEETPVPPKKKKEFQVSLGYIVRPYLKNK
jgi:hypothetical protein